MNFIFIFNIFFLQQYPSPAYPGEEADFPLGGPVDTSTHNPQQAYAVTSYVTASYQPLHNANHIHGNHVLSGGGLLQALGDEQSIGNGAVQEPKFPPQHFEIPDISAGGQDYLRMQSMHNMTSHEHNYVTSAPVHHATDYGLAPMMSMPEMKLMPSEPPVTAVRVQGVMTSLDAATVQQQQSAAVGGGQTSPTGSTNSPVREGSSDSDDTPLGQVSDVVGVLKYPTEATYCRHKTTV